MIDPARRERNQLGNRIRKAEQWIEEHQKKSGSHDIILIVYGLALLVLIVKVL